MSGFPPISFFIVPRRTPSAKGCTHWSTCDLSIDFIRQLLTAAQASPEQSATISMNFRPHMSKSGNRCLRAFGGMHEPRPAQPAAPAPQAPQVQQPVDDFDDDIPF